MVGQKGRKKKPTKKGDVKNSQEYDFPLFFSIWMTQLGLSIPAVQLEVINFIEKPEWINNTALILLWRSLGKTLIINLWIAYKLSKIPSLRFLVIAGDKEKATDNVATVREIIYTHPLCQHLIRGDLESRADRFFCAGYIDRTNPSVRAASVDSRVTGKRCDILILDDAECGENSGTPGKRRKLRRNITEAKRTLLEGGKTLVLGTYHDTESLYDELIDRGADVLKVPLLTDIKGEWPYMTGTSQWPERFDKDEIFDIQLNKCDSKSEFYSQYLLIPKSIKDSRFDQTKLKVYDDEVEIIESGDSIVLKIGERIFDSVSTYWDPSGGRGGRDHSVLAIVFTDKKGDYFVHRVINVSSPDHNEMVRKVKHVALEFCLPLITVEKNGIGEFVGRILIEELKGTGIGVEEHYQTKQKQERIIEAIETRLYSGHLYVHVSVMNTGFSPQLRDFDASQTAAEDDYIDAVSSAIMRAPILINSLTIDGQSQIRDWAGNASFELEMPKIEF